MAVFNAAEATRVASLYAEDAVYMSPSAERVEGRSTIELYTRSAMPVGSACSPCSWSDIDTAGSIENGALGRAKDLRAATANCH